MEKFACPCCGYRTFHEKPDGTYSICQVCLWEDDPFQLKDPSMEDGANKVSLKQGQKNFKEFGACDRESIRRVRKPNSDESRSPNWTPLE